VKNMPCALFTFSVVLLLGQFMLSGVLLLDQFPGIKAVIVMLLHSVVLYR